MKNQIARGFYHGMAIVLLIAVVQGALFASGLSVTPALAYSPPSAPGQAYYVDATWSNKEYFNGRDTTYAYQLGYAAHTGLPTGYSYIFLDFGRQLYSTSFPTPGWGVCLVHYLCEPTGQEPDSWVQTAAQDFMSGYNDGHTNASFIAVGTNNSDYPWTCQNSGTISPNWQASGADWGSMIANIGANPPTEVVVRSASDIEPWANEPGLNGWQACGLGAEAWYTGYESQTTTIPNADFGTEDWYTQGAYPTATVWTETQVYDVVYGRTTARGVPEIYCAGNATPWVGLRSDVSSYLLYWGTTSDNASSQICDGNYTLGWYGSWVVLNSELASNTPTAYPNDLLPASVAFHLSTPTALPTSTPTP